MRPAEHLVTAAQRRILSAPGVLVGSWGVHVLRSRAPLSAHRSFDTLSYLMFHIPLVVAGCICMCSIYFDFRATSFS